MLIQNHRTQRDIRPEAVSYLSHTQEDKYRIPVSVLEAKYAGKVKKLASENKSYLKLVKWRGEKCIIKTVILTESVKRKLNRILPKIKETSTDFGGFVVGDISAIARVNKVAAHKYINILLAGGLIVSDNKAWSARYTWNTSSDKSCL